MFRAPLLPVLKNILYMIFEGHPFALSLFIHSWGVATALLAYRLGKRFGRTIGFILGLFVALNLPISAHFHHISITTALIPLVLVAFDRFCAWLKNPTYRRLFLLILATFLCCLTHPTAIALIPVFWLCGWAGHRSWKQAALFLIISLTLYNSVCLLYYVNFGYWQTTKVNGYSLHQRVNYAADRQFSAANGPASFKIAGYLKQGLLPSIGRTDMRMQNMSALCLAQKQLGYNAADELFFKAGIESIRCDAGRFLYFTVLRFLGHFCLAECDWLKFKETAQETASGHMWGFEEQRMIDKSQAFLSRHEFVKSVQNPLKWEKKVLQARFLRAIGLHRDIPALPQSYNPELSVREKQDNGLEFLYSSEGNMSERLWHGISLDAYFYYGYWGQRGWWTPALRILKIWDMLFILRPPLKIFFYRALFVLWITAILFFRKGAQRSALAAMLSFVVFFGLCIAVFSDNFGGRHALYAESLIWLGGICGLADIASTLKVRLRAFVDRRDPYRSGLP